MKKILWVLAGCFVLFCLIGFAFQKPKDLIADFIFTMAVEQVAADSKEELLKPYKQIAAHKHSTLYFTESDENLIELTKNALDRGMELNKKFVGSYDEPVDLVLLKNKEDMERIDMSLGNGLYSPQMNLIVIVPEDREALAAGPGPMNWEFNKQVMHEYTHYILGHKFQELKIKPEEIPSWLAEGFAEYIGSEENSVTVMEQERPPLTALSTQDQWQTLDADPTANIYLQSYIAVRYLIHTYGEQVILDLLNETQITHDFNQAFKKVTGLEIDELEYYDENDIGI
ncbi:peptidase MA family metallohydrolase [Planococcus ruber]|uniref:peptidase MA family metallohydrolase n=1 Tax=Planococcus ruber TaxID=2027871 RepID=UPI001FEEA8A0|nr:collagenase [Planococcus ruber]